MKIVLQFLITGSHDDEPLLDALVGRIECVSEVSELGCHHVNHLLVMHRCHFLPTNLMAMLLK